METKDRPGWTRDQRIAVVGMLILTLSVGASCWYHISRAAGAMDIEFNVMMLLFAPLLLMTILYALRLRWSYAAGIFVCVGFFVPVATTAKENVSFISLSLYSVSGLCSCWCYRWWSLYSAFAYCAASPQLGGGMLSWESSAS